MKGRRNGGPAIAKLLGRTDASILVDRAEEERCTSDRVDRARVERLQ
jgi:hypothetical protein